MYLGDTYKNPFSDYNANTLDAEQLIAFWESPFSRDIGILEEEVATERTSIVFTGGRGTGKTMLLRYFSFNTQVQRSIMDHINIIDQVNKDMFIGFYIRVDAPLLTGLSRINIDPSMRDALFIHFLELTIFKSYIEAITTLFDMKAINKEENSKLVDQINSRLHVDCLYSLRDILNYTIDQINYINDYRSNTLLKRTNADFAPTHLFMIKELCSCVNVLFQNLNRIEKNINHLILIDEYENFSTEQQRIVNTMIRMSSDNNVTFRIGMRMGGFHTADTISADEYIKAGRDYRNISLVDHLIKKGNDTTYFEHLRKIAEKRLNAIPFFSSRGLTDICVFLGENEDPETEGREIVNHRDIHINEYLPEINKTRKGKDPSSLEITRADFIPLEDKDNPLFEMQNLRLLLKPNELKSVIEAYNDYISGRKTSAAHMYYDNYFNKYRLSYVFLLCSIYRANKKYYSFNCYCYLSSGIVGNFIELCRAAFQYANFDDRQALAQGKINPKIQSKAAISVANDELEEIKKIHIHGTNIYNLVKGIGNDLSTYYRKKRISYPETTQFTFSYNKKNSLVDETIQAALSWSMLQQKIGLQQASIGKPEDEIFVLNRIFSPVFGISYRTRGGYNPKYEEQTVESIIQGQYNERTGDSDKQSREKKERRKSTVPVQGSLCDILEEEQ